MVSVISVPSGTMGSSPAGVTMSLDVSLPVVAGAASEPEPEAADDEGAADEAPEEDALLSLQDANDETTNIAPKRTASVLFMFFCSPFSLPEYNLALNRANHNPFNEVFLNKGV